MIIVERDDLGGMAVEMSQSFSHRATEMRSPRQKRRDGKRKIRHGGYPTCPKCLRPKLLAKADASVHNTLKMRGRR